MMPLEPMVGEILRHRRTGTLYRVLQAKPKDLSATPPMPYAYYDIETVATGRKTWTNEYRIDKDYVLEKKQYGRERDDREATPGA